MKKQNAVEWLVESLETLKCNLEKGVISIQEYIINVQWAKGKAKEMEREQKEYFFNCGRQYQLTGEGTFTEVYNETYK